MNNVGNPLIRGTLVAIGLALGGFAGLVTMMIIAVGKELLEKERHEPTEDCR